MDKIQTFPPAKVQYFFDIRKKKWTMDNGKWKIVSLLAGIRAFLGTNMHKCSKNAKRGAFWPLFVLFSFRGIHPEEFRAPNANQRSVCGGESGAPEHFNESGTKS